ncbi:MAG: hypothetical protein FWH26_05980 [Oscillospiraceae bacterium]|nr:hypothetical protein [Oscillospiraceae bacterium]
MSQLKCDLCGGGIALKTSRLSGCCQVCGMEYPMETLAAMLTAVPVVPVFHATRDQHQKEVEFLTLVCGLELLIEKCRRKIGRLKALLEIDLCHYNYLAQESYNKYERYRSEVRYYADLEQDSGHLLWNMFERSSRPDYEGFRALCATFLLENKIDEQYFFRTVRTLIERFSKWFPSVYPYLIVKDWREQCPEVLEAIEGDNLEELLGCCCHLSPSGFGIRMMFDTGKRYFMSGLASNFNYSLAWLKFECAFHIYMVMKEEELFDSSKLKIKNCQAMIAEVKGLLPRLYAAYPCVPGPYQNHDAVLFLYNFLSTSTDEYTIFHVLQRLDMHTIREQLKQINANQIRQISLQISTMCQSRLQHEQSQDTIRQGFEATQQGLRSVGKGVQLVQRSIGQLNSTIIASSTSVQSELAGISQNTRAAAFGSLLGARVAAESSDNAYLASMALLANSSSYL